MNRTSTAYILVNLLGYRYSFDGVTSISHSMSLKVATDSDTSGWADVINNARNEPDVVTLSVVASDTHVPVAGWASQTLRSLCQIKENRLLCTVVTSMRSYSDMLLTAISVLQDENAQESWSGTLTFTHFEPAAVDSGTASAGDSVQSSTAYSSGTASTSSAGSKDGSVLQTILREAGIGLVG